MSSLQPSRHLEAARPAARPTRDIGALRARRQRARRRTRLARIDLGLGLLAAIILLILSPGLAITALVAGVMLVLVSASALRERRRSTRDERSASARRS